MVSCAFKPHIFNLQLGYLYWQFNTYNLKIEQNKPLIEQAFSTTYGCLFGLFDAFSNWKSFKSKAKAQLKKTEKYILKRDKAEETEIQKEFHILRSLYEKFPNSVEIDEKLLSLKIRTHSLRMNTVKSMISKTHYRELETDRYSIATARVLQKNSSINRTVLNIRNLEGNITEKQDDVLLEYERQYAQLFKSGNTDPSSIEEFMLETPHGTANAEDRIRFWVTQSTKMRFWSQSMT